MEGLDRSVTSLMVQSFEGVLDGIYVKSEAKGFTTTPPSNLEIRYQRGVIRAYITIRAFSLYLLFPRNSPPPTYLELTRKSQCLATLSCFTNTMEGDIFSAPDQLSQPKQCGRRGGGGGGEDEEEVPAGALVAARGGQPICDGSDRY